MCLCADNSESRGRLLKHNYNLLFFQGTADVLAGLEAVSEYIQCVDEHIRYTQNYTLSLSVRGQ